MTKLTVLKALKDGKTLIEEGFVSKRVCGIRDDVMFTSINSLVQDAVGAVDIIPWLKDDDSSLNDGTKFELANKEIVKHYEEDIKPIVKMIDDAKQSGERADDLKSICGAMAAVTAEITKLEQEA